LSFWRLNQQMAGQFFRPAFFAPQSAILQDGRAFLPVSWRMRQLMLLSKLAVMMPVMISSVGWYHWRKLSRKLNASCGSICEWKRLAFKFIKSRLVEEWGQATISRHFTSFARSTTHYFGALNYWTCTLPWPNMTSYISMMKPLTAGQKLKPVDVDAPERDPITHYCWSCALDLGNPDSGWIRDRTWLFLILFFHALSWII